MRQPSAASVRDTLAALLRDPAYERGLRETVWNRVLRWLGEMLDRLAGLAGGSDARALTIKAVLVVALALLVARVCYLAWARRPGTLAGAFARGKADAIGDPWATAEREAGAGRHTEAAQLLYLAILRSLAAREGLRLHHARTLGDYHRDLRRRGSTAAADFGRFARRYEAVIYGLRGCDRDRYEELRSLARPLVRPEARTARTVVAARG